MKVYISFVVCAVFFYTVGFAQNDTGTNIDHNRSYQVADSAYGWQGQSRDNVYHDGFMVEKGRMMIISKGAPAVLIRDTTLSNGVKIMQNGAVVMKDGSRKMLKEGEHVDMSGNVMPMHKDIYRSNAEREKNKVKTRDTTNRKKDMYLVPDTSKKNYIEKK